LKNIPYALSTIASAASLRKSASTQAKSIMRRTASQLVDAALLARSRALPYGNLGNVLVIAPHPDDETIGCGGLLALMARDGRTADIAFVTDGGASHTKHATLTSRALVVMRKEEARAAAAMLGLDWGRVSFLDAPDGELARLDEKRRLALRDNIAARVTATKADVILLPTGSDGSSEHEASFAIVKNAVGVAASSARILEYPVWARWNPIRLLPSVFGDAKIWRVRIDSVREAKARAMACYSSQMQPIPPDLDPALPEGFAAMFLGTYEFFVEYHAT
jgi:LmbE family N-acetylglucosaminyl deacetylase